MAGVFSLIVWDSAVVLTSLSDAAVHTTLMTRSLGNSLLAFALSCCCYLHPGSVGDVWKRWGMEGGGKEGSGGGEGGEKEGEMEGLQGSG